MQYTYYVIGLILDIWNANCFYWFSDCELFTSKNAFVQILCTVLLTNITRHRYVGRYVITLTIVIWLCEPAMTGDGHYSAPLNVQCDKCECTIKSTRHLMCDCICFTTVFEPKNFLLYLALGWLSSGENYLQHAVILATNLLGPTPSW